MGIAETDLKDFHIWNLRGHILAIEEFIAQIESTILTGGYSLIILDPIYKLLGRLSENSAEDVAEIMNALDRLAVRSGAAIVISHHFSKGNQSKKEAIDRVSGSGVWARDPDSLIMVTRHKQENAFVVSSILRNHPPVEDFVVEWEFPLMRRCDDLNPEELRSLSRGATFTPEQVLETLRNAGSEGLTTGEWKNACSITLGMSGSTFHNKMSVLREDGRVTKIGMRNFVALPSPVEQAEESVLSPEEESINSNFDSN
jgi:hypothetical protein